MPISNLRNKRSIRRSLLTIHLLHLFDSNMIKTKASLLLLTDLKFLGDLFLASRARIIDGLRPATKDFLEDWTRFDSRFVCHLRIFSFANKFSCNFLQTVSQKIIVRDFLVRNVDTGSH